MLEPTRQTECINWPKVRNDLKSKETILHLTDAHGVSEVLHNTNYPLLELSPQC